MSKIPVMIIDQKKNSVVVEIDAYMFRSLGIKTEDVKKNSSRRSLNNEITSFLTKIAETN